MRDKTRYGGFRTAVILTDYTGFIRIDNGLVQLTSTDYLTEQRPNIEQLE